MARRSGREKDVEAGLPAELVEQREAERRKKKALTTLAKWKAMRCSGLRPRLPFPKKPSTLPGLEGPMGKAEPVTKRQIAQVLRLRKKGLSYRAIEEKVFERVTNGTRAFAIVKKHG